MCYFDCVKVKLTMNVKMVKQNGRDGKISKLIEVCDRPRGNSYLHLSHYPLGANMMYHIRMTWQYILAMWTCWPCQFMPT